jgi:hypothetical protein
MCVHTCRAVSHDASSIAGGVEELCRCARLDWHLFGHAVCARRQGRGVRVRVCVHDFCQIRFVTAGLGWASADAAATRLVPFWVGARGIGFDWRYTLMALESRCAGHASVRNCTLAVLILFIGWRQQRLYGCLYATNYRRRCVTLAPRCWQHRLRAHSSTRMFGTLGVHTARACSVH